MKNFRFYGWAVFLISMGFLIFPVFSVPGIPHQFYGTITVNGNPAPDGTIVSAKFMEHTLSTMTLNGEFGTIDSALFFVTSNDEQVAGDVIFSVEGEDVETVIFESGELTELNLSILLPEEAIEPGPQEQPGPENGSPGGPSGGGPSGGSNSTNLLKLDKVVALIDENVTASVKCFESNGCVLKIDGVEAITFGINHLYWQEYTTSFDSLGEKTFEIIRGRTAGTVLGSTTVTIIEPPSEEIILPEIIVDSTGLCEGKNCNDSNPCTLDSCVEGECVFFPKLGGEDCSGGKCESGKCISENSQGPEQGSGLGLTSPIGFFGLESNSSIGIGLLLLAALVGGAGYFYSRKIKEVEDSR